MRKALLAAAVALGLGFGFAATSGAEAATLGTNISAIGDVAKSGAAVAEKTYYRRYHRRYWGHHRYWGPRRYYWRHRYYRHHRRW